LKVAITLTAHRVLFAVMLTIAVFANYVSTTAVYERDYPSGVQPGFVPLKTATRISIYNVSDDRVFVFKAYGLLTGFAVSGISGSVESAVVSIRGEGLDLFIALLSLYTLLLHVTAYRKLGRACSRYYLITALLLTTLALLIAYAELYSIPSSKAYLKYLREPLTCTDSGDSKLCLIDVVANYSIVHITVKGPATLYVLENNTIIREIRGESGISETTVFANKSEYKLVLETPPGAKPELVYRRVFLSYANGSVEVAALAVMLLALVLVVVATITTLISR